MLHLNTTSHQEVRTGASEADRDSKSRVHASLPMPVPQGRCPPAARDASFNRERKQTQAGSAFDTAGPALPAADRWTAACLQHGARQVPCSEGCQFRVGVSATRGRYSAAENCSCTHGLCRHHRANCERFWGLRTCTTIMLPTAAAACAARGAGSSPRGSILVHFPVLNSIMCTSFVAPASRIPGAGQR